VPVITPSSPTVIEGDSGSTPVVLFLRLSRSSNTTATVRYATSNRSAKAGADYVGASGTATFAPGTRTARIELEVIGDTLGERGEVFQVDLRQPSVGVKLAGQSTLVTIEDDDDRTPPVVQDRPNQLVESPVAPVAVTYVAPPARDNLDGSTRVVCRPRSGSSFRLGTTAVTCSSADRNGNVGTSSFDVLMRRPTTAGGTADAAGAPRMEFSPGQTVRASAGGFAPGSVVAIFFTSADGSTFQHGRLRAGDDGRIVVQLRLDRRAALGRGQLDALGVHTSRIPFLRVFPLQVVAP
jgi:hypothetical protein